MQRSTFDRRPWPVYHTERSHLCTAWWTQSSASRGFICSSWVWRTTTLHPTGVWLHTEVRCRQAGWCCWCCNVKFRSALATVVHHSSCWARLSVWALQEACNTMLNNESCDCILTSQRARKTNTCRLVDKCASTLVHRITAWPCPLCTQAPTVDINQQPVSAAAAYQSTSAAVPLTACRLLMRQRQDRRTLCHYIDAHHWKRAASTIKVVF